MTHINASSGNTQYATREERRGSEREGARKVIDHVIRLLSEKDLPCTELAEQYLRHKWRLNYKPGTLFCILTAIEFFLAFLKGKGINLQEVRKDNLEAFIEYEQDRGNKITSVKTRMVYLLGFLRFLIDEGVISPDILRRKIRFKLPESLPRAINPDEIRQLVSVIDKTRDRAMIVILLRTGMRIGELLNTKVIDLNVKERKIEIYEGEKNSVGRVIYLSDDAIFSLRSWLRTRDPSKEFLFYSLGRSRIAYSTCRDMFVGYLGKAGLANKGYTLHSLRHTFASELLNAGMRLECLQQLLGHQDIEVTRRYARLTDKTREEEYFTAMSIIEKGGIGGTYRPL